MKTLLRIDSSLRIENSYSRRAGDTFVQEWKIRNPSGKVKNREVGTRFIPHLDQALFEEFHTVRNPSKKLRLSDELIAELFACDEILITVPMYNFGIPSSLKAYFDLVVRNGKTFRYEEKSVGLLQNKKAYILSSMGGIKSDAPSLVEMHLQQILNYIGIRDIVYYALDGTADEGYARQQFNNQNTSFSNILNK
ncbi:FMN-dependent NADH-azoreductase [Sphingobacterium gobiense]|uniref:FMN dependent NADH:quinone oxidoreductase n=1 Tax=Sphingobacterium gobiense TaxID=1382456 RepID=A0A2S9JV40_9SPHI|nr:NAD(P)H-dependent oxidoreductase [Sphingobacterium gobiense]PRD57145.1 FMN-dependent NADH-azoreductase [Sphingobacterium gobiense]